MAILKKIFFIICLVLLIFIIACVSLVYLVDPNQLKPILIEETKKHTGQQLEITGPLSWSFYPHIAIHADQMSLRESKQLPPSVNLQNVNLAMRITQLLKRNKEWQGTVFVADAQFMNVHAEKVSIDINWKNEVVSLQNIKAAFYGGNVVATGEGRDLSALPHWRWNAQATNTQLQALIRDLQGADSKLTLIGNADLRLQIETVGRSRSAILNSMKGAGELSIKNGVIHGIDFNYFMQTADALINKRLTAELNNTNQTPFESLQGAFVIKNGKVETENLLLTSPTFITKVQGTVALTTSDLNLHLEITPQQTALSQWHIPLSITGDLHHPEIKLEINHLDKLIPERDLDKIKSKALEKIKERIHGKPAELLQRLLR